MLTAARPRQAGPNSTRKPTSTRRWLGGHSSPVAVPRTGSPPEASVSRHDGDAGEEDCAERGATDRDTGRAAAGIAVGAAKAGRAGARGGPGAAETGPAGGAASRQASRRAAWRLRRSPALASMTPSTARARVRPVGRRHDSPMRHHGSEGAAALSMARRWGGTRHESGGVHFAARGRTRGEPTSGRGVPLSRSGRRPRPGKAREPGRARRGGRASPRRRSAGRARRSARRRRCRGRPARRSGSGSRGSRRGG
jgi:hypothetical protein